MDSSSLDSGYQAAVISAKLETSCPKSEDSSMRILHVLPSLRQAYGGPVRAVFELAARSRPYGIDEHIIGAGELDYPDNPLPPEAVTAFPVRIFLGYRYSPALCHWVRENLCHYDGVVLHGMWTHETRAVWHECMRQRKRYVCFPHGMLDSWAIFRQGALKAVKKFAYWLLWEKRIFRSSAGVVFTTHRELTAAGMLGALPIPKVVVPYGIYAPLKIADAPSNPALEIPAERRVALFLGRIHPKKNVPHMLRAWAAAHPPAEWQLVVAGPAQPDYLKELLSLQETLGLSDSVTFTGMVTGQDKAYLLQHARWFLLPSCNENFANAVLEAISAGCPVAISDQVYFSEFLHPESVVLPLEHRAWVDFFQNKMTDEPRRQRLIALDQVYVKSKFEAAKTTTGWVEMLRQFFARKPNGFETGASTRLKYTRQSA